MIDATSKNRVFLNFSKNNNNSVITFGSCLSRFTAEHYIRLYCGRIESTVYNNRTDFFIRDFLDGNNSQLESLKKLSTNPSLPLKQQIILRRQTREEIGILFQLSGNNVKIKYTNFMNSNLSPDLIIIDNYIDLVGKSVSSEQYSNLLPFFCTASEELKFRLGSYISIEKSLNGYRRIISYLHERFKNAKLVFLSFPSDGYEKQHEIHKRKIQFDSELKNLGADLCLNLHLNSSYYFTVDSQHFKPAYYAAIASSIYSLLS